MEQDEAAASGRIEEEEKEARLPVALVCGSCGINVQDSSSAIELCSECDQLRCSDCASLIRLKSLGGEPCAFE